MRSKVIPLLLIAAVVALALAAGCSSLMGGGGEPAEDREGNVAQNAPPPASEVSEEEPTARVASQVSPSVVQVNVEATQTTPFGGSETQEGQGSGVVYRQDGYIITNNHVVDGASTVNVAFADGSTVEGTVVGGDPNTDLAVVQVEEGDLPAAAFVDSNDVEVGQLAVAIGSPSGFQTTVTSGIISGLNREIPPEYTRGQQQRSLVDLIQTDAAISPGSSGGALVNRAGEVIGINVAYIPQTQGGAPVEGIGFAIPSTTAISVADRLIEDGEVTQPFIGINLLDLAPEVAEEFDIPVEEGVLVADVQSGTPADDAGLQNEDVITAVDETPIESTADLFAVLRQYSPGDQVQLTITRDGNEQAVDLTLTEEPA